MDSKRRRRFITSTTHPTNICIYIYIYVHIYIHLYLCIYIYMKNKIKFNDVLVNRFYYYNYNKTKVFDDPVAFLRGTNMLTMTSLNPYLVFHTYVNPWNSSTSYMYVCIYSQLEREILTPSNKYILYLLTKPRS